MSPLAALLLALGPVTALAADAPQPVVLGESHTLRSGVLGETRSYQVRLPRDYRLGDRERYPVLYVLDGETQFAHTATTVDFLASEAEIPEMIVVAVASTVRVRDFTQSDWSTAWVGGGGADSFKRFLAEELIPHVEQRYRANGYRLLVGHSAGAQFVLHVLASAPAMFRAYVALSASLDWDGRLPIRELEAAFERVDRLPAFLYVGEEMSLGGALTDQLWLRQVLRRGAPRGLDWRVVEFPRETHTSLPLEAEIDALRTLFHGYRIHPDDLETMVGPGVAALERRYALLSKSLGFPFDVPEAALNGLGYAQLGRKEVAAAIATFERAVREHPDSANANDSLADAYAGAERWEAAADSAGRAAELAARFDHPQRAAFDEHARKARERWEKARAEKR